MNPIKAGVKAGKKFGPRFSKKRDTKFSTTPARAGSMRGKPARFNQVSRQGSKSPN